MGDPLITALSMDNHHPCTMLTMDPAAVHLAPSDAAGNGVPADRELHIIPMNPLELTGPDINLPLSTDHNPPWGEMLDMLDVGLGPQSFESEVTLSLPKSGNVGNGSRKCAKRGDSVWGAWFFFNFYFKPVLTEKSKGKVVYDAGGICGFEKSDIRLDVFLVQHDMENMYMWAFKERPENALGKMQLRSFMNGHSRPGEPSFPFSVEKGFSRSHRMQRKHYRGLSNPQCLHGVETVKSPDLSVISDADLKRWSELTGREPNFAVPTDEASDYELWRNLPSTDFELERPLPLPKGSSHQHHKKQLNGSSLNLSTQSSDHNSDEVMMDLSPKSSKRKKDFFPHGMDEDYCAGNHSFSDRDHDMDIHAGEPPWSADFSGVMKHANGPVTAAKTIYEDDRGYLLIVSMPFSDPHRVKVTWKNTLTHGVVKIWGVSTARMPYIKRNDRTFKLTDLSPEHCPPGEFVREIPLATRIPEDANLEAYFDENGGGLEIIVPKHRVGPEEHEVPVCMRPPHLAESELHLAQL